MPNLTPSEIAEIEKKAEAKFPEFPLIQLSTLGSIHSYHFAKRVGYIAAACEYAAEIKRLREGIDKILKNCKESGLKMCDTENKLHMAIYFSLHTAKQLLNSQP